MKYLLYRLKYRYGNRLPLSAPVDVLLELSSLCNMRCAYCYHSGDSVPFEKKFMPFRTACKILGSAAVAGVNSLKFNWRGEPTMNPSFSAISKIAKDLASGSTFLDRVVNSNFKFRNDPSIFYGLANMTKVKVSFDSFDRSVFNKQRQGGDFNLTRDNIDRFYNHPARIKSETRLVVQAVRSQLNKDEDVAWYIKTRWPDAEASVRDVVGGRVEKDISDLETKKRPEKRIPCQQAFVRLIFDADGNAHPCCPDIRGSISYGNIETTGVRQLFRSAQAAALRKALKSGEAFGSDPCRSCSSFESYAGFSPPWDS